MNTPIASAAAAAIDLRWTVNELTARIPRSLGVLHALGVHTCCTANMSVADAAADANVDVEILTTLLQDAAGAEIPA